MEYAGYQLTDKPTDIVDWAGLTGKVADKITSISKDREARKQELDDIKTASQKEISKSVDLRNRSLQSIVIDGADQGRTLLNKWNAELKNGTLDPKTYKQRIANLNDNWQTLAGSAQTYDQRYEEVMKRQQPDENGKVIGSNFELELASRFGTATELKNKKIRVDEDGFVFLSEIDPTTGEIIRDVSDVNSLNRPENMIVNKVDVNSQVEEMMKGFKASDSFQALARGGSKTITSILNTGDFPESRKRIANAIAPDSNPKAQLSVLVDNGVIDGAEYYETESEKKQKLDALIAEEKEIKKSVGKEFTEADRAALELKFFKLENIDGIITPILTPEQQKLAKDSVEDRVNMSIETAINYNAPESYNYNGTGGGDGDKEVDYSLYEKAYDALMTGKPEILNNMSGGKYKFTYTEGEGISVEDTEKKRVIRTGIKELDQLRNYLGMTSISTWEKQKKAFNEAGGRVSKPASDVPTGTRAEFKAAGWTEAQINQGIKEGSIKVK